MPLTFQLVTPRLLLRPWREDDRAPFAALNADPHIMRFFAAPMTRAESDAAIDRYTMQLARDGFTILAVELRANQTHAAGPFVGLIGMQVMRDIVPNLPQPAVEIGWRLAAHAQGLGLATEGASAVVHYAFHTLNLPDLVAITVPANTASRHVMHKLGMIHRPDLTFDHPRVPPGHPNRQHVLYHLRNSHTP